MARRQALGRTREPLTRRRFVTRLLSWHAGVVRSLSVREAATPWEVLVVEVMSQRTQIERVGLAWRRFVETSPSPVTLAEASTRDLLSAWAGLGYNRRALALREAARRIVSDHAGDVPDNVADLAALPGIGPYSARAIAATAFGVPVAPLDVNVRRVMSRVTGIDPGSSGLQATADTLVDRRDPRRWVNAVMDLASGVCTRTMPRCDACPVFGMCASRGVAPAVEARRPHLPFPRTTRWLRGRLISSLTEAPADAWVPLPDRLGTHDRAAIMAAAESLEREGFLVLLDGHARVRP